MAENGQEFSEENRVLTDEEENKLLKDTQLVSDFKQNKLETEAKKNWDLFYKRNETNFFKDRHWISREFTELTVKEKRTTLLEVGCGCGNTVFPLLDENDQLFIYACDFSPRAVEFVKKNPEYNEASCNAFQCDLTKDSLTETIKEHSIDIVSIFFVMSAILPNKMEDALRNVYKVLKPGGMILFRDYGLYDHAMLRFSAGHKLGERLYVRQDGTRSYFFDLDTTKKMFESCGFDVLQNTYVFKRTVNKKEAIDVPRVFVQGKFVKRIPS